MRARWVAAAVAVLVVGAAACTDDDDLSAECEAVELADGAITNLQELDIEDEGVLGVESALLSVGNAVNQLDDEFDLGDAADDLVDEIEDLARGLGAAAEGEETNLTVGAVVPALNGILDQTDDLVAGLDADC